MNNINIAVYPGVVGMVIWFLRWAVSRWELNEQAKREAEVRIAERQTLALDRIAGRVDEHTAKDLEHHAEVKEAVIKSMAELDRSITRIDAKLDAWATPVEVAEHPSERRRRVAATAKAMQGT